MVTHGCMRRGGKSFPTMLLLLLVAAIEMEFKLVCPVDLCLIRCRLLLLSVIHAIVDYA